jgi:hypothetical protein
MKDLLRESVCPVDALVEQVGRLRVGLFGMTEQEEMEAVRRCHNLGRWR